MKASQEPKLSRRQQQILDVIYSRGEANVREIQQNLADPPTTGAIRRMLGVLLSKGAVECKQDGVQKVYRPRLQTAVARKRALQRVVDTFFSGSVAAALTSLLSESDLELSVDERESLSRLVEKAREQGR